MVPQTLPEELATILEPFLKDKLTDKHDAEELGTLVQTFLLDSGKVS